MLSITFSAHRKKPRPSKAPRPAVEFEPFLGLRYNRGMLQGVTPKGVKLYNLLKKIDKADFHYTQQKLRENTPQEKRWHRELRRLFGEFLTTANNNFSTGNVYKLITTRGDAAFTLRVLPHLKRKAQALGLLKTNEKAFTECAKFAGRIETYAISADPKEALWDDMARDSVSRVMKERPKTTSIAVDDPEDDFDGDAFAEIEALLFGKKKKDS